jgi:hypothetical protein
MTRMWLVNPDDMCQQHRLGEHKEIHDLVGFIRHGHIEKVVFHASRGQVFPSVLRSRHAELERYDGHTSPVDVPDVATDLDMTTVTPSLLDHNRRELARRCEACAERQV